MAISTILKELRKSKNLTQYELSIKLKIGQATIAGYENGTREPHINSLILYANFFECSIDYLVGREDDFGNITVKAEKPAELTPSELTLLDDFRTLPAPEKAQAQEYIHFLASRHAAKKKA